MTQAWVDDAKYSMSSATSSSSHPAFAHFSSQSSLKHSHRNVAQLLAWREVSPRAKHSSKKLWGETSRCDSIGARFERTDARHAIVSWVEAESLRRLSAEYCPLLPPPRSTIAAAFSSDGKTLASTHGDHTVKVIDCQTGSCLKVLSGHRRTPWVVRFHPLCSEVLASGSLDHEVRLWNARTADCIGSRDFYRPIASIAFHAQGDLLAVASGHKLYIWNYNRREEASSPTIVLKTRRSLRAVHFHPHAAPLLLTAEVNDLDSPDSPLTLATSSGYLQYPPPAVFFANINSSSLRPKLEARMPLTPSPYLFWPTFVRDERRTLQQVGSVIGSANGQERAESSPTQRWSFADPGSQADNLIIPMEISSAEYLTEGAVANSHPTALEATTFNTAMEIGDAAEAQPSQSFQQPSAGIAEISELANNIPLPTFQYNGMAIRIPIRQSRPSADGTPINSSNAFGGTDLQMLLRSVEGGQLHQFIPFTDPACWELPFLHGWMMGQTHAGLQASPPLNSAALRNPSVHGTGSDFMASDLLYNRTMEALIASSSLIAPSSHPRGSGRSGSRHPSRSRLMASAGPGEGALFINTQNDEPEPHPVGSVPVNIQAEISTSMAAAAAAELPCTVKLRIWPHDIQDPSAPLDPETCRLTIPHAVLCSEMGAHFSPCGRFLVACVACTLPHTEGELGFQSQMHHDAAGDATSPTRHPISAQRVMYELRVYSLEEATFGSVLASRAIRAAHCLTSIQFSPTSEHILLAYGRRHSSLLRSVVVDGETTIPIYTILEVYRVSDMELVRVLPSAEDEVNVACFHPLVGGGLVYGTKEGKLRILQHDGSHDTDCSGPSYVLEENILEVQRYALEC